MPRPAALLPSLALVVLLAVPGVRARAAQTPAGPASSPAAEIQGYEGVQGYEAGVDDILNDINLFWASAFESAGQPYAQPSVNPLQDAPIETGCGPADAAGLAFYCPIDQGIYVAPAFLAEREAQIGDFAAATILAHEWGHHVQTLLAVERAPGNAFELQADCLAGAFALDTRERGQLSPGDVTEAVNGSAEAGDPAWLPQDEPGAHGTNDDRISAFMRGYLDGLTGCGLPLAPAPDGPIVSGDRPADTGGEQPATNADLASALPGGGELPAGLVLVEEGARGLRAIAATFPDPAEATRLLAEWGFQENAYRHFAADDGTLTVQVSLHRFATEDGAAAALPYYAEGRAAVLGLREIPAAAVGDQSATIVGALAEGNEATVYARRGNAFARVSLVASGDDPTAAAMELAAAAVDALGAGAAAPAPPAAVDLAALLPTATQAPPGFAPVEEGARGEAEIAASFPDPTEAAQGLADWGWRENAYRTFAADGGATVEVSLHRFATPAGAAAALPYYAEGRAATLGLSAAPLDGPGDQAAAVTGPAAAGNEATLYVRTGAVLARVSAVAATGDPATDAAAFVSLVLANAR